MNRFLFYITQLFWERVFKACRGGAVVSRGAAVARGGAVAAVVALVVFLSLPVMAQSAVTVDLAEDSVDITTGFNGAYLKVFGVREAPGELAIVIAGPRRDMIVRKKERLFGVWANLSGIKFRDVPVYYDYALADPALEAGQGAAFKAQGIGMDSLHFPTREKRAESLIKEFQEAMIRNKQAEGRFPFGPQKIIFLSDSFFKTSFYMPSNVPIGEYKIQVFLIQKKEIKEIKAINVHVGQVGLSAGLYSFAKNNGLLYGMSCVIFALFMGWLSNFIRRRV